MKSTQKVTKIKLNINPVNDFVLLGIVSADPDYKLSLALNKAFKISLKSILPVTFIDGKGNDLSFSRFSNSDSSSYIIYNLISNRSGKHFLLKKFKNIDYLLQAHDSYNEINISLISETLRDIEAITAVFILEINLLKDKNLQYIIH